MTSTLSPGTCTPSFPTTRPTSISSNLLPGEIEHCADLQQVSISHLAESTTFAYFERFNSKSHNASELPMRREFPCFADRSIFLSTVR